MRKIFFTIAFAFVCLHISAVPAAPYPIEMTQPDGSTITVYLHGDEHYSYYSLPDGTPLRRMESGFFQKDSSVLLPAEEIQTRFRKAQQTYMNTTYPLTGSPRSLVILMSFTDLAFAQTRDNFNELLNESGYSFNGATGSARDYFIAASDSIFSPIFDVYGPYVADHDIAYYGEPEGSYHDKQPYMLIVEACQKAAAAGVNMQDYDTDGDGILDNIFVFYAGNNEAEGGGENTIWPHRSDLTSLNIQVDGVRLASYACTSEYRGTGTTRAPIGTFCHEFGHVLGLPDFYDTSYDHYTIGNWDIMCSGSYNNSGRTPPTYASHERFYLGWLNPVQLTEPGEYFMQPLTESNSAYLIAATTHNLVGDSPSPKEYFLLEYRARTGWDTPSGALPGTGMLVWHIDYNEAAWFNNTPNNGKQMLRTHLEEANGISWKDRSQGEDGKPSDPYPGTQNVTTFTPKLHDGTVLHEQNIFNISEANGLISFIYSSLGSAAISATPRVLSLTTTVSDNNTIEDWKPLSFLLNGTDLDTAQVVSLTTSGNFYLAAADEAPSRKDNVWKKTISVSPDKDGNLEQRVWVSFLPVKKNCDAVSSIVNIAGHGVGTTVALTATAPRHTYVETPVVKPVSNLSPYSFRFAWEPQSDATAYYLTMYTITEGTSTYMQSFENFNSADAVRNEGWETTTYTTTTSAKAEGTRALYLKNTGDCITTPDYQSAVSEISFWLNAFATDIDTVGILDIEVWNGTEWLTRDECRTAILSTTKKKTFTYSFGTEDNFTRFRLTYTDNGASGCALDVFTATCSQNINYLYNSLELAAMDDPAYTLYDFTDLNPSTTYYCTLQATDEGLGCEPHRTAFSEPLAVTTLSAENTDTDRYLTYDAATHTVYVPAPENGNELHIFDHVGRLIYKCPVKAGQVSYPLPVSSMRKYALYIVKYVEKNDKGELKMKRKQRYVKVVL
ncbi:MAG: M6 family metalloprotease domain-containing protein [Paludibacteraceae bacterium]